METKGITPGTMAAKVLAVCVAACVAALWGTAWGIDINRAYTDTPGSGSDYSMNAGTIYQGWYNGTTWQWQAVATPWAGGGNALNVSSNGNINGTHSITGSNNTATLNNGTISGTLNLSTDNNNKNTLNINPGGTMSGTVNVNWGFVNVASGNWTNEAGINGVIATTINDNAWTLAGGNFGATAQLNAGGTSNIFTISNTANFTNGSQINFAAGAGTTGSLTMGDMNQLNTTGFDGAIAMASSTNTLTFNKYTNFNANAVATLTGDTANAVVIDAGNDAATPARTWWDFKGLVDLSGATATTNTVAISSGNLTNTVTGSVIGSSTQRTTFTVTGGATALLYSSGDPATGSSAYSISGGNVYNIRHNAGTARDTLALGDTLSYSGANRYTAYSLLNLNSVTIGNNATVRVGTIGAAGTGYAPVNVAGTTYYKDDGYQITADVVTVNATGKLIVHEDWRRWNSNQNWVEAGDATQRNVINTLNVSGEATIDRTTIHGTTPGTAVMNVLAGGVLRGFGQPTPGDTFHTPLRANLVGDLNVMAGGTLEPYDRTLFPTVDLAMRGVIFETAAAGGVGGTSTFQGQSILSTRLFGTEWAAGVQINTNADGPNREVYLADSLKTVNLQFNFPTTATQTQTPSAQPLKVQYRPVFGFQNDLKSKLEFDLYKGDANDDTQTYYYYAARSDNEIKVSYDGGATYVTDPLTDPVTGAKRDANHLFNRDILFSDMLGDWFFDKTTDNKSVVLRYRMLAKHPTEGGIAIGMNERNARESSRKIDEMRYPFQTDYSDLAFPTGYEPGFADRYTPIGSTAGYSDAGYDGNIVAFYQTNAALYPNFFNNYRADWVDDFDHFLRATQIAIGSAGTLNQAMRLLHPEPYASLTGVNHGMMNQFIANRERNAVSALFQVEDDNRAVAAREAQGIAYASLVEEADAPSFVANPLRLWASGFGADGRNNGRGDEYGFKNRTWGGSVGAIKEMGDLYLGLTIGYGRATSDWAELQASAVTNSYMAEALLGYRCGLGFIEAHGNYSYNDQNMTRQVFVSGGGVVPDYNGLAKGAYHDNVYGGGIRIGRQIPIREKWLLIPTIGVTYLRSSSSAFVEEGRTNQFSLLSFRDGDIRQSVFRIPLMVRLNRAFAAGCFVVMPEVRAGATASLGDKSGTARAKFVGNPVDNRYFQAYGVENGPISGQFGASLELSRRGRFYAAANYDFFLGSSARSHNYSVQVGINF